MSQKFSDLLRAHRSRAGQRQRDLGTAIGVSAAYISDVELGRRDPFTPPRVLAAARALDLTREETDALAAAAATERLAAYSPKEMIAIVVDRVGRAAALKLVDAVCAERKR